MRNPGEKRNVVLIGQSGIGKTTLAESLLFGAKAITKIGKTVDGSSHFDFEPEEIKRGNTLKTAVYELDQPSFALTLIDTPGSSSFIADTISALRGGDAALLVVGGASGLKVQGEKAWELAGTEQLARAIFVNELDKERATLDSALAQIRHSLGIEPLVTQFPIGSEDTLRGVVDLFSMRAWVTSGERLSVITEIPAELKAEAEARRTALVERIAETNDELLEQYLAGENIPPDVLATHFHLAFASGTITPLFCGSAERSIGIHPLLQAIQAYFPAPTERKMYQVEGTEQEKLRPELDSPFAGFVFKTFSDPYTGQVSLVRVISGTLHHDQTVVNGNTGTSERVGKLYLQLGKEHKAVDDAGPGEIVAISKLKDTRTGHTLCEQNHALRLAGLNIPESCMTFAVEPKTRGDEDKIISAIERITVEDPAIHLIRDPGTHETLISGLSQNHIEITLERIKRKYNVEIVLHAPKVPYRETIRRKAEAQGRHKKQTGGRGQFGDCWLRVAPRKRGEGFLFNNEIFGGSIPKNYIPAVEKGIIEAMAEGFLAGYPLVDLECAVYDGSYHAVDSSDLAFKIAASKGFKLAVEKAEPVLLEPIMAVQVTVPEETTGEIIGDLNSRRGRVLNMETNGHNQVITAHVPLAEMLTYAADLRSISADRGVFHMEIRGYEEVPAQIAAKTIQLNRAQKHAVNS